MENDPEPDDPLPRNSPLGEGIAIANQVIVVCLGLVIPISLGFWADAIWNSAPLLLLLGLGLGMLVAGFQLKQMLSWLSQRNAKRQQSKRISASGNGQPIESTDFKQSRRNSASASKQEDEEVDPWEKRWSNKWADPAENDEGSN